MAMSSPVVVLTKAENTYLRLADASVQRGNFAMAELLRGYASLVADNAAYLAPADSRSRPSPPQLHLPAKSRAFTPDVVGAGVQAVLLDMYMTLVELRPSKLPHVVLADILSVHPDQAAAAYKHFANRFLIGAITPFDRMKGIAEFVGRSSISDDEIHGLTAMEIEANVGATYVYPGVEAMIASYRSRGYLVGIVSNATPWGIAVARHHGLIDMVDAAGFSADPTIGTPKPFAAIYENVCARLGVLPSACLFVDDGGKDFAIEGAQMLGMTTLRVDHPGVEKYRPVVPLSHYHTSRIAGITL